MDGRTNGRTDSQIHNDYAKIWKTLANSDNHLPEYLINSYIISAKLPFKEKSSCDHAWSPRNILTEPKLWAVCPSSFLFSSIFLFVFVDVIQLSEDHLQSFLLYYFLWLRRKARKTLAATVVVVVGQLYERFAWSKVRIWRFSKLRFVFGKRRLNSAYSQTYRRVPHSVFKFFSGTTLF